MSDLAHWQLTLVQNTRPHFLTCLVLTPSAKVPGPRIEFQRSLGCLILKVTVWKF